MSALGPPSATKGPVLAGAAMPLRPQPPNLGGDQRHEGREDHAHLATNPESPEWGHAEAMNECRRNHGSFVQAAQILGGVNECRRNHGSFVQAAQILGGMRVEGGVVGGNERLGCRP